MRITFALDDDVSDAVRAYAKAWHLGLGEAIAELIRRGLPAPLKTRVGNGFPVIALLAGSPRITSAHVKALQDV